MQKAALVRRKPENIRHVPAHVPRHIDHSGESDFVQGPWEKKLPTGKETNQSNTRWVSASEREP